MADDSVTDSIARIHNWLMGWVDDDGGLHSPVVHKFGRMIQGYPKLVPLIRVDNIEDSTWHQAVAVLAYANLYKKTGDKKFLDVAERLADRLVELQTEDGSYRNSNFEHDSDPFRHTNCVIHQAFPDIALLEMYDILKKQRYLKCAKDNVDTYLLVTLFDEKNKIFFDFERSRSHTANMTSVGIEALVRLYNVTCDDSYLTHAKNNGDWIYSIFNGQYVPYSDNKGGVQPQDDIQPLAFYNGITLQGLDDLFYATRDEKYLKLIKVILGYLLESTDPKTGFFYHRKVGSDIVQYPQYVAASGIILWNVLKSMKCGASFPIQAYIKNLNNHVYPSGGIRSYIGYGGWEDILPCPAWVSMAFAALCEYEDEKNLQEANFNVRFKGCVVKSKDYTLVDEREFVTLKRDGEVMWCANKKEEVPEVNKIKAFYQKDILLTKMTNAAIKVVVGNKVLHSMARKVLELAGR